MAVQDDLPFILEDPFAGAGADPVCAVDRAENYGKIRAKPLRPADDPIAAAEKLAALPRRTALPNPNEERATLRREAWQTIASLVQVRAGDRDFTGPAWEVRKKAAANLKIRWDVEKQNYVAQ